MEKSFLAIDFWHSFFVILPLVCSCIQTIYKIDPQNGPILWILSIELYAFHSLLADLFLVLKRLRATTALCAGLKGTFERHLISKAKEGANSLGDFLIESVWVSSALNELSGKQDEKLGMWESQIGEFHRKRKASDCWWNDHWDLVQKSLKACTGAEVFMPNRKYILNTPGKLPKVMPSRYING